uniref:Predicted protein n=1 Tax=Hordeum vulgare subsp. vulgare TaxID=112509 RepID=F2ELM3_HORVV|nr:predicted protein [Hordeum vulgare subsp. vulgare]
MELELVAACYSDVFSLVDNIPTIKFSNSRESGVLRWVLFN